MGLYINPPCDKKQWLLDNGKQINFDDYKRFYDCPIGTLIVTLIDNFRFTAGLVLHDREEFDYIKSTYDKRPHDVFLVSKQLLKEVCSDWDLYIKE